MDPPALLANPSLADSPARARLLLPGASCRFSIATAADLYQEGHKFLLRVTLSLFDLAKDDLLMSPLNQLSSMVMSPLRVDLEQPQTLLATVFSTKIKDSSLRRCAYQLSTLNRLLKMTASDASR